MIVGHWLQWITFCAFFEAQAQRYKLIVHLVQAAQLQKM
jgi:hypothetical protein